MKASPFLIAGVAALVPMASAQWHFAAAAEAPRAFSPPTVPMVLSRTVIRELAGGKQIVVKRSFRVQFVASPDGFVVTGTPLAVSVDVPPILSRLGELERQRSDSGPFPILIDNRGLIHTAASGEPADAKARQDAKQVATGMIQGAALPGQAKREALEVLGTMTADPRSSPWPTDLFVAHDGERRQHRSITLGDGSVGEVEVLLRIGKWLPCGMPALFERIITTDLAGTRRVSHEVWSLEPIAGA